MAALYEGATITHIFEAMKDVADAEVSEVSALAFED